MERKKIVGAVVFASVAVLVVAGLVGGKFAVSLVASAQASVATTTPNTILPELPEAYVNASPSSTPSNGSVIAVHAGSNLQTAINNAQLGDTLVLDAGATFSGNYTLPAKSGSGWITIESSDMSQLPPFGTRVSPSEVGLMATIMSPNTGAAITIADQANHYRLQGLEITVQEGQPLNYGLVQQTISQFDANPADLPSYIIFDRDYVHGQVLTHGKYGISLAGPYEAVDDSYISEFHGIGQDTQAITSVYDLGPLQIDNNYLEASGENILLGSSYSAMPGATQHDLEIRNNYMYKPQSWMNGIVPAPANLSGSLASGGSLAVGTTYYYAIVAKGTAGDLTGPLSNSSNLANSKLSSQVSFQPTSGNQSVSLTWNSVSYGDSGDTRYPLDYAVLRTTDPPTASTRNWGAIADITPSTPNAANFSYTDTGGASHYAWDPSWVTDWSVKNIFELKDGQRVLLDGNILDGSWVQSQVGYAILLTVRTIDGTLYNPAYRVNDVTITNNIIRNAASGFDIGAEDSPYLAQEDAYLGHDLERVYVGNNIFDNINGGEFGYGTGNFFDMSAGIQPGQGIVGMPGPQDLIFNHNTINQTGNAGGFGSVTTSTKPGPFVFTNNTVLNNYYGFHVNGGPGSPTASYFQSYFNGEAITGNIWINNDSSVDTADFPSGNFFPTNPSSVFVNWNSGSGGDYHLAAGSPYAGKATDGTNPGANIDVVNADTATAISGASTPANSYSSAPLSGVTIISGVTSSSATLSWWTSGAPQTSQVGYGITASHGSWTPLDTNLVTSHSVTITGLQASTTYYFETISANADGSGVTVQPDESPDPTFTTAGASSSGSSGTVITNENTAGNDGGGSGSGGSTITITSGGNSGTSTVNTSYSSGSGGGSATGSLQPTSPSGSSSSSASIASGGSIAQLEAELAQLEAEAQTLIQELAQRGIPLPAGVSASVGTGASSSNHRVLNVGTSGSDVTAVQEFLFKDGDYPADIISGYFGALTQAAVGRFQVKYGIVSGSSQPGYGQVGPLTWGKIDAMNAQ